MSNTKQQNKSTNKALKLGRIAVLMGGNSAEREISLDSGEAVYKSLKKQGIDCFKFNWHFDNLPNLWQQKFDKAFIILHGRGGEDGYIQEQLAQRGIAFTGSNAAASKDCMDKSISKDIWQQHNLPLSPWVLAEKSTQVPAVNFPLPWAVKPILEGSSIGISKVNNATELDDALLLAWKYDKFALIEKWIEGDEYTVAILNGKALPAIQIKAAQGFYDYDSKYLANNTQYLCPCGLTSEQEKSLKELAMIAFTVIGAKTWGRVDFILNQNNEPYLLANRRLSNF
ncbi:MAG: D-alanine--D-alanine ligase [Candidatus Thioglobus sp.]|nr:MAG: D-alanine--D-alanine ligase [Candidatus Thioglobus sp.]